MHDKTQLIKNIMHQHCIYKLGRTWAGALQLVGNVVRDALGWSFRTLFSFYCLFLYNWFSNFTGMIMLANNVSFFCIFGHNKTQLCLALFCVIFSAEKVCLLFIFLFLLKRQWKFSSSIIIGFPRLVDNFILTILDGWRLLPHFLLTHLQILHIKNLH